MHYKALAGHASGIPSAGIPTQKEVWVLSTRSSQFSMGSHQVTGQWGDAGIRQWQAMLLATGAHTKSMASILPPGKPPGDCGIQAWSWRSWRAQNLRICFSGLFVVISNSQSRNWRLFKIKWYHAEACKKGEKLKMQSEGHLGGSVG